MTAARALRAARRAGVRIFLEGEEVRLTADQEPPAELLELLRATKPELVELLRAEERWTDLDFWCLRIGALPAVEDRRAAVASGLLLPAAGRMRRASTCRPGYPKVSPWPPSRRTLGRCVSTFTKTPTTPITRSG